MNRTSTRLGSTAIVSTVTTAMLLLAPAAAFAGTTTTTTSYGKSLNANWTQIDGTEVGTSELGNVHMGYLYGYQSTKGKADVYGSIDDFDCPEGVMPYSGHGDPHDPDGGGEGCTYLGNRWMEGTGLALTMNGKLETANIKGQLTVYGGGGGHFAEDDPHGPGEEPVVVGRPAADITWTGVGSFGYSKGSWSYRKDGVVYKDSYKSRSRDATLSGSIGPMGFDPALSSGSFETSTSTYSQTTP